MKEIPIALLPCYALLWLASILVRRCDRADWRREWTGEIWYRWNALHSCGAWNIKSGVQLYLTSAGCLADAWGEFSCDEERLTTLRAQMRTPTFCALVLAVGVMSVGFASGSFTSTRTILSTLPYRNASRLALVSRTGRLQSIRKSIPENLAASWLRDGKLVEAMAFCSFSRPSKASIGQHNFSVSSLQATKNLLDVMGEPLPANARSGEPFALLSYSFWQRELRRDPHAVGQLLQHRNQSFVIAGVLPENFWFVSPSIEVLEFGGAPVSGQSMLIIRAKPDAGANQLEKELSDVAERNEMPFTQTAPHVLFLADALHTPVWLFGGALLMAAVVIGIGHGSRLKRSDRVDTRLRFGNLQWWLFLILKTAAALVVVFTAGVEIFIGANHQITTEPLGGPALLWFYTASCSLVLLAVIADQQARCRVCLQCLAFPIRVGCPGCLFLDWSGTELLCPEGHGVLYVPHHQSCWDEAERWVAMEM